MVKSNAKRAPRRSGHSTRAHRRGWQPRASCSFSVAATGNDVRAPLLRRSHPFALAGASRPPGATGGAQPAIFFSRFPDAPKRKKKRKKKKRNAPATPRRPKASRPPGAMGRDPRPFYLSVFPTHAETEEKTKEKKITRPPRRPKASRPPGVTGGAPGLFIFGFSTAEASRLGSTTAL